jgi:hypothetical protein
MVKVMDGLNSMPWLSFGRLANGWIAEGTQIPLRNKFKYGYDLWSNGLAFEAFGIGRTYKVSIRARGHGDGLWLFNFDSCGRAVNASFTGTRWGDTTILAVEPRLHFRTLPYPQYRPEMHRLLGGTWLKAKWADQFDRSGLTYRAEIVDESDSFCCTALTTLDEFVQQCRDGGVLPATQESTSLLETFLTLPLRNARELKDESDRFHRILRLRDDIPVEPPELAFDHYHAIPVKVQDGCGGPCTFCSLYDRRIRIPSDDEIRRQIDEMADYLGEELDHFSKVVLLEGDALTVPAARLDAVLRYARDRFALERAQFAHAFAKAATVAAMPQFDLSMLREAGLLNVNFGLESGCQDLLDLVKRGQKLDEFRHAVSKVCDAGMRVSVNIICGLGGTRFHDRHVSETVRFLQSLPSGVTVFYSPLTVSERSKYAINQRNRFGGEVSAAEMAWQEDVFESELGASEYLFIPM